MLLLCQKYLIFLKVPKSTTSQMLHAYPSQEWNLGSLTISNCISPVGLAYPTTTYMGRQEGLGLEVRIRDQQGKVDQNNNELLLVKLRRGTGHTLSMHFTPKGSTIYTWYHLISPCTHSGILVIPNIFSLGEPYNKHPIKGAQGFTI